MGTVILKQSTDQIEAEAFGSGEPTMPQFLKKLLEMVEDSETDSIVSWSHTRDSFVVWDLHEFSKQILPVYFKHNNFSSFNTQLNAYGFRKIGWDKWEFANPGFQQGKKHLMSTIKRRPNMKHPLGLGELGLLQAQVEVLTKDKDAMRSDVTKLREQLDHSMGRITSAEERLRHAEPMQQQILLFLSDDPDFGMHQKNKKRKARGELGEGLSGGLPELVETGQGADCRNHEQLSAKDEGISAKLYKIFVEFEELLTKPSELEASIQSLLP